MALYPSRQVSEQSIPIKVELKVQGVSDYSVTMSVTRSIGPIYGSGLFHLLLGGSGNQNYGALILVTATFAQPETAVIWKSDKISSINITTTTDSSAWTYTMNIEVDMGSRIIYEARLVTVNHTGTVNC